MPKITVPNAGSIGVIKDLSSHELPIGAWTDARNIRFLDGYAYQFLGHGQVYGTPSGTPQYVMPVSVSGSRYWIYTTASKTYVVTNTAGSPVTTDITHATPRTGTINEWTGTVFGGIPILNANDGRVPMYWDQNLANKFVDLTNWPVGATCKVLRSYKNYLVALGLTISGTSYPYMVKWSHPADPGALPSSWDDTDATKDSGKTDLAEGQDIIVDGKQLGDTFIIYKEASIWRMDLVGGQYIFTFRKVLGTSGAMNKNCIEEIDGFHFVLTGQDVIIHDGNAPRSVMDKQSRRYLFQNIDVNSKSKCFVFKNPFLNECYVAYPSIGSSYCDKAMVWNWVDKTVSFRDLPNVNHANFGPVDNSLGGTWASDSDPWNADLTAWNGPDFTPDTARVIMASQDTKLFMLDASATFDGTLPNSYLERRGLSFDNPDRIKLVTSIRPRITGNNGDTVLIQVGVGDDPYKDPTYLTTMTYTIGTTISCDCLVSGRYIAIKFLTGTAAQWRLDSFDVFAELEGYW